MVKGLLLLLLPSYLPVPPFLLQNRV
ncbi:hypothetical protein M0802_016654, partial [Mischocyttarus mexicanus]